MITALAQNWWTFTLRGVLALLFGILAFVAPGATLTTLIFVFGFFAILNGLFALYAAWNLRSFDRWWLLLLEGLLGIAAGVIAFVYPRAAALAFLSIIAAWAILVGILQIVAAIRLRQEIKNEWSLGLSGLASVVFGVLLVVWPRSGLVAISWIIGLYAIAFGIMLLVLGSRLRGLNKSIHQAAGV
ncbi:MAG TPA: HdeD family acid-resistance protein [Candidatus Binatia bacterium]|nr:HdeD family acid-resistance protein [Candidatus Binatia bacterium]